MIADGPTDIIGAPGAQVYMNAAMGAEGELITRPFFNSRLFPDTAETDFSCLMRQTSFNYSLLSEGVLKRQLGLAHATPTNQSQAYLFLSMAIYLFSNNLVEMTCLADSYFALFAKLDTVFELVSQEVFQALLQSRLASIRVAGEKLLLVAGRCKQVRFFRILIDFGFADGWIDGLSWRGPDYLWCAASMGLEDVVQRLLTKGCRPDQRLVSINGYRLSRPQSVIDAAIENHHFECGQILLRYCDVNRPLQTPWNFLEDKEPRCLTTFQSFILHLSTASPTDSNQSWIRGLQMMLNAGANPDEPFTWQMEPEPGSGRKDASVMTRYFRQILPSRPANHRSKGWPSILDYLFYFNRPVFDQFSHYSQSFKSQVTRAGVLLALEKGNLDHYLELKKSSRNNEDVKELLQTILAEQFILRRYMSDKFDFTCKKTPPKPTDLDLVHALLDLGINFESGVTFEIRETIYDIINYFSGDLGLPPGTDWHCDKVTFLLHAVTSAYPLAADLESECHAVQLLIDRGAVVTSWDLEQAARRKGTRLLKLLLAHISYIATNGTRALAIAAKLNNIEAVGLLLDSGVDVNSEFDVQKPKMRELSILAYTLFHWAGPQDDSSQMTNILLARGAILRVSQAETHVSDLLSQLFYYSTACESPSSYKMACFLVDNGLQHGDPYILSASMLERCVSSSSRFRHLERPRRALFKYLLRKGALVRPGSPLTAWILADGETSIVQELLKKGADKNSYNTEHELWVLTPLQAAAMACDEETVLLLLRVGANVNAPARGKQGRTALQAICSFGAKTQQEETGKRRIIQSLLDHGADVNAAPARKYGVTALQIAAHEGDLAIVILLLRHGADPNAPLCQLGFLFSGPNWGHMEEGNALDLAAREGRLDMVKLLLNANALSFKRGESGYDEAIELAEKNGHIVVADLIRQHAAQGASDEDLRNPYFSQPPRDWREYNYESDDDSDLDDDSESD